MSHLLAIRADIQDVRSLLFPLLCVATLAGCMNAVGSTTEDGAPAGRTQMFTDPNAPPPSVREGESELDVDGDGEADFTPAPPATEDSEAQPPPTDDPDGDGAVQVSNEPPTAPSDANQSCSEWMDCGPHFADPNSGFDCVSGTCTCDDTGQWSQACADIGGSWSSFECFCYVGTAPMPTAQAVPPNHAFGQDDDVICWWRWKDLGCDPDRWVDTSYYERVCDSRGCWQEYVDDGYYVDGECYGRWVRRCDNGYEYW